MFRPAFLLAAAALALTACHTGPGTVGGSGPVVYRPAPPPPAASNSAADYAPGRSANPPPGHGGIPPGQAKKHRSVAWGRSAPPPWWTAPVPARSSYRTKRRGTYYMYEAPYGIAYNTCYRERLGQVLGGAAGAAAGYQVGKGAGRTAAVIGGTIVGILVGGHIGRSMDELDQNCVGQVLEHAPPEETVSWEDRRGAQYRVTPTETYETPEGRYCREYQTTATIGGRTERVYGTACRQPDGSWQIVN